MIQFYTSDTKKIHVISGVEDGRIYVHNLHASAAKPFLLEAHMSTVTCLAVQGEHTLIRYQSQFDRLISSESILFSIKVLPVIV